MAISGNAPMEQLSAGYVNPPIPIAADIYSGRQLTYQGDVFDAFRGYLADCGVQTYWGVPVFSVPPCCPKEHGAENGFCRGLLWQRGCFLKSDVVKPTMVVEIASKKGILELPSVVVAELSSQGLL